MFLKGSKYSQKTPELEPLFKNVAGLKTCNFIKKRPKHKCFPVNIAKSLRLLISKNISEQLLSFVLNRVPTCVGKCKTITSDESIKFFWLSLLVIFGRFRLFLVVLGRLSSFFTLVSTKIKYQMDSQELTNKWLNFKYLNYKHLGNISWEKIV